MTGIILDSCGLEPSAKARRYSEQSCRGRDTSETWDRRIFFGKATNTTNNLYQNTQMEIVSAKCLLNSKEFILNKPTCVLNQKCRSIYMISEWYQYFFCFSLCSSKDWLLWILPALCWPRISGKRKHSRRRYILTTSIYYIIITLCSYHWYSKYFVGENPLFPRERVDAIKSSFDPTIE